MKKEHESYGMVQINKFSSNNSTFFGSDISHMGGISITISEADVDRKLSDNWYHSGKEIVRVEMSASQYVDAITSGMNTQGVPCTILRRENKSVDQICHIEDKKNLFMGEMKQTQDKFKESVNDIISLLEGNIGKRKKEEIKKGLERLKWHISSNTNFVLKQFNEAMEKTVTEAKHSISNYIDNKVHTLGIEAMKDQLQIGIEPQIKEK